MGSVYRARDLHFPNVVKLVAVKEMVNPARDPLVRETIVKTFEREANLLATLSHPSIPRIYDYFTQKEHSYLVLEFVKGKDLEAILDETPEIISEEQVIRWAIELCDVLHYLHTHDPGPVIFRDMKPSNVMIDVYNRVVLVDFGIARSFQSGEKGTMIGTEGYSPPEQYRGDASALADIYALGATMHHLLTRRDPRLEPPFSFQERPIREINPNISLGLEGVVNTALQYNPADRFPSAEAMKEALTSLASRSSDPTMATTLIQRPSPEVRPLWSFECQDEIRGTPSYDKGVVYVGSYDHNLYAIKADEGTILWKYATDGGIVSRPVVVAEQVCFGSEDYRLHVVSNRNGSIAWTYYTGAPIRSSPYQADGHIFIGSDDRRLHAVNLASGRGIWQTDAGAPIRSTPLVRDDSIYCGNEDGDLLSLDYRGAIKWRFKARRAVTSTPVISKGLLYFTSLDGTLYALDARTGWVSWRFRLGKGSISTPCLAGDLVFTGAIDGMIYCVEVRSAKEVWRFATNHQVTGSPLVYQDSLYCGSVDGCMYCLDYQTGKLRWKFSTGGPITGTPVAHEDVLFFGSTDHQLYALPA
jgi:outer membrane protein assembly factor BamB/tRNA A-37 threonylcarbamoyl transferase component Bud32